MKIDSKEEIVEKLLLSKPKKMFKDRVVTSLEN